MPKKTSRAARTLQTQRVGERKSAARPLVDPENNRLVSDSLQADSKAFTNGTTLVEEPEVERTTRAASELETRPAVSSLNLEIPAATSASTIRPASRRPYARRTTANPNRQPVLSREEEYSFIRSDLVTVFILTVLMIVILVVLTFVIGR